MYLIKNRIKEKTTNDNVLNQWKDVEEKLFNMSRMSRDELIVSAANVECERIFNIVEALYDHRKSYNSIIFFALMMIRFHDQKKNSQTKLNADLAVEKKLIIENLNKKMKKRVNEL